MKRRHMTAARVMAQVILSREIDWQNQTAEQVLESLRQGLWPEMDLWTIERAIRHLQEGDL